MHQSVSWRCLSACDGGQGLVDWRASLRERWILHKRRELPVNWSTIYKCHIDREEYHFHGNEIFKLYRNNDILHGNTSSDHCGR